MTKAKDKTIFHERLKLLLEESGHNQVWLAKTLGFSTPSVNGWTQDSEPSFSTLCKIAELFDVTTDYLLGITESKSTNFSLRACAQITGLSDEAIFSLLSVYRGILGTTDSYQIESISALLENHELILTLDHFLRCKSNYGEVFGNDLEATIDLLGIEKMLWELRERVKDDLSEIAIQDEEYRANQILKQFGEITTKLQEEE